MGVCYERVCAYTRASTYSMYTTTRTEHTSTHIHPYTGEGEGEVEESGGRNWSKYSNSQGQGKHKQITRMDTQAVGPRVHVRRSRIVPPRCVHACARVRACVCMCVCVCARARVWVTGLGSGLPLAAVDPVSTERRFGEEQGLQLWSTHGFGYGQPSLFSKVPPQRILGLA